MGNKALRFSIQPRKVTIRVVYLYLLLSFGWCQETWSSQAANQQLQKTPLTRVEVVTDIDTPRADDDPGTGGGIDSSNYFSRRLAEKISVCTDQIRTVTEKWAKQNQLVLNKVDRRPGDLLIQATKHDLKGLFELTYRVNLKQERADVTLYFYSQDGFRQDPAVILTFLKTYKVETFQDELTSALMCGDK